MAAHFCAFAAVENTVCPRATQSWIAAVPMPLVPPWINTVSPGFSRAPSIRLVQTVKCTSGNAAALRSETPLGTGSKHCVAATAYSA